MQYGFVKRPFKHLLEIMCHQSDDTQTRHRPGSIKCRMLRCIGCGSRPIVMKKAVAVRATTSISPNIKGSHHPDDYKCQERC